MIIITGANRGLGKAISERLMKNGEEVIGLVRSSGNKDIRNIKCDVSDYSSVKNAVAFVNATSALQIALKLIGTNNRTEIIVPTVTFVAPINAIIYNSGSPIFMDVDKYFNIDLNKTLEFLDKKTKFKNGYTINKKTGKKFINQYSVFALSFLVLLYAELIIRYTGISKVVSIIFLITPFVLTLLAYLLLILKINRESITK